MQTSYKGMTWTIVTTQDVDEIAAYIIKRLGYGKSKRSKRLSNKSTKKTRKNLS